MLKTPSSLARTSYWFVCQEQKGTGKNTNVGTSQALEERAKKGRKKKKKKPHLVGPPLVSPTWYHHPLSLPPHPPHLVSCHLWTHAASQLIASLIRASPASTLDCATFFFCEPLLFFMHPSLARLDQYDPYRHTSICLLSST